MLAKSSTKPAKYTPKTIANSLDEVAAKFLGEVEEARSIRRWLFSNSSNFAFLLNKKDLEKYKKICVFILNYINALAQTRDTREKAIQEFLNILSELDAALGNANYGIVKNETEFKNMVKNDR